MFRVLCYNTNVHPLKGSVMLTQCRRIAVLPLLLLSSWSSYAEPALEFRFQVSEPGLGCWFDRQASQPNLLPGKIAQIDLNVKCAQPRAYRIESTLTQALPVKTKDGQWLLSLAMGPQSYSCETILQEPQWVFERYRDVKAGENASDWRLCMKAQAQSNQISSIFPVSGVAEIVLVSPTDEPVYPENTQTFDVLFAHNSASLSKSSVNEMTAWIREHAKQGDYRLELHAHASDSGERQYNHDLSLRRLSAVRQVVHNLVDHSKNDVWGQAWGEMRLKALNAGEVYAAENRRVTLVFVPLNQVSK